MSGSDKDTEVGSPAAAELWRRIEAGNSPGNGLEAPDPLLIAAYVDGTLDPQARDRIEAWMAVSSDSLDLVLMARSAHTGAPPAAPPTGLLVRAQGLVRTKAAADTGWRHGVADGFAGMMRPGVWAATAAAMLFAAVISFELGREAAVNLAATQTLTVASAQDDGFDFGLSADDLL